VSEVSAIVLARENEKRATPYLSGIRGDPAKVYGEILAADPQNVNIRYQYAIALEYNNQISEALAQLQIVLLLDARHDEAQHEINTLLYELESMEETAEFCAVAVKEGFSPVELRRLIDKEKAAKGEIFSRDNADRATAEPRPAQLDDAAKETTTPKLGNDSAEADTPAAAPVESRGPRLKWETDRLPDEDPATFAWRAYAAEAKAGNLHRGLLYDEDRPLYWKLHSWLRSNEMPADVDIPLKRDWNTRQLAKLGSLLGDPHEVMRLAAVARRRASTPNI
jgi:hypothetical protein